MADLTRQFDVPTIERDLTTDDVARADEVLLASTPLCLLPVTQFNNRPIGSGQPGTVFQRLIAAWSAAAGVDIVAQAVKFKSRG
jgi:branched-subunit amino acid aminotransferase/4-amino-4-deoxychorismate lyase